MQQLDMFPSNMVSIVYERRAGSRRGLTLHSAVVYDEAGDAIIGVDTESRYKRGLKELVIAKAREAWILRKVRPFGDEYTSGIFHVYYLYEA